MVFPDFEFWDMMTSAAESRRDQFRQQETWHEYDELEKWSLRESLKVKQFRVPFTREAQRNLMDFLPK